MPRVELKDKAAANSTFWLGRADSGCCLYGSSESGIGLVGDHGDLLTTGAYSTGPGVSDDAS